MSFAELGKFSVFISPRIFSPSHSLFFPLLDFDDTNIRPYLFFFIMPQVYEGLLIFILIFSFCFSDQIISITTP